MFSQFYDTLKAKNPNALYLLYIVIELKIIHNNENNNMLAKSIMNMGFDFINTERHFSVLKMIKKPSNQFLSLCFMGFFANEHFCFNKTHRQALLEFFPTEVLLLVLNTNFNPAYNSNFSIRLRNSQKVNSYENNKFLTLNINF
jgi:hypothetical protein